MTNVTAGDQAILQQASNQKGHPKGFMGTFWNGNVGAI